jgi:hypothetical protein
MAGVPNFQSLGVVLGITAAMREDRRKIEFAVEVEEMTAFEGGRTGGRMYGEDGFVEFKVNMRLRIRSATRPLKTLFRSLLFVACIFRTFYFCRRSRTVLA